jgi:hypothetical protein
VIKKVLILILLVLNFGTTVFSQQLSHQVFVPAAGVAAVGGINYSQTVGEAMVEIITSSEFVLTQGFQQPGLKLLPGNTPRGGGVEAYPNPVTDILNIVLFGETTRSLKISIINISGTVVYSYDKSFTDRFYDIREVSVSQLTTGLYFIRVISNDGIINRTFKIEKI